MQFRRILVPTDFSEESKKAIRHAVDVARSSGAEIVLAHVVELLIYPTSLGGGAMPPSVEVGLRERLTEALEALRAKEIPDTIRSRALLLDGRPSWGIVQAVRDLEIDLIVIATRGNTGFKHIMLGSTAERVVREAPCPVLVVRGVEREGMTK